MTSQSRKIAAVLFALSLLTSACFKSKTKVFKLRAEEVDKLQPAERASLLDELKKRDGALYRLPRTVVVATVPVKKTTKEPGAFEKFTPCFFSKGEADDRTATPKASEYALQRVTFSSAGEPDPDETYVVLTRGGFFESKTLIMDYTPDLRLKKGEAESKNEALEFISKAAKTGIGIAARAAALGAFAEGPPDAATLAATRFSTAARAKKCYDLIKSYQDEFYKEAGDKLAEAEQAVRDADTELANATTPAQKQLAQQKKENAEKEKKAAAATKEQAEKLQDRAAKDAAEMAKALRAESMRARAASSVKAQRGGGSSSGTGGGSGGGTATGTGGGTQGSGSVSPQLLEADSLRNAKEFAEHLTNAVVSNAKPSDGNVTYEDLASIIPATRLKQLRAEVGKADSDIITRTLLEALNAALAGPMLYTPDDLPGASAETLSLVAENPQGERLVQLNRMLLEQAFPGYIRPRAPSPTDVSYSHQALVDNYDRAERTFGKLEELLTKQDQLRSSTSNIPPDTFRLELEKTDAAIGAYRESFLGAVTEETWEGVFKFTPKKDALAQLSSVLFLLSPTKGVCTQRGLVKEQGVRISSKFADANCATHDADQKDRVAVWLRLDRKSNEDARLRSSLAFVNGNYNQEEKERGWYFCIPAVGTVVLKSGTLNPSYIDTLAGTAAASVSSVEDGAKAREAGRGELAVAQLGVIASVPAGSGGRTTQSSVVLDEATGALLNFKVSSNALLEKTLIDDAKEASDSIIDARDPLKRLERENSLLDAKKNNRDKRKALENPDSNSNANSNANNNP